MFVLVVIPLSLILRKALFMDDLKLYSCNEKELESLVQKIHIFSKEIGMEFSKSSVKLYQSIFS